MEFNAALYGPDVEALLTDQPDGLSGLVAPLKAQTDLKRPPSLRLFNQSPHPAGALSGLWLYLGSFDEAHEIAQEDKSAEGSFWHAIAHRREPDYSNASYWYRQLGGHPVYPAILEAAKTLSESMPGAGFSEAANASKWNPHAFVEYCEEAAQSRGEREQFALELQRAEWEILFDYCARPRKRSA